jgi:hypothetical protein
VNHQSLDSPLVILADQALEIIAMSCKSSAFWAALLLATVAVSLGAQSAGAASAHQRHHHHLYAMYRGPFFAPRAALPHAPEYGFLSHVPANAIRGPGYTFVPGVGYRDVQ